MDSQFEFRRATKDDNLEEISELLYKTDTYIYPYWFETLEKCKKELSVLLLEDKFFFNINNIYIMKDAVNGKIIGLICVVDNSVDLNYDYTELEKVNDRYNFIINNYVKVLIKEVMSSTFAYISNVCVLLEYRGKNVASMMIKKIISLYRERCFNELSLDVLANNSGAIKLYKKLGFEQSSGLFDGFNSPALEKPDAFSMNIKLK